MTYIPDDHNELIARYENMLKKQNVGYFDTAEFELIINYYDELGGYDDALTVCEHALAQHPHETYFLIQKAHFLLNLYRIPEAEQCLDQIDASNQNLEYKLIRAALHIVSGKIEPAIQDLRTLLREHNDDPDAQTDILLWLSTAYETALDFDKAQHYLTRALKIQPQNELVHERLWSILQLTQQYANIGEIAQQLIENDPYNKLAWYTLGITQYEQEQYEQAAESFEYAYIVDKNFGNAYFQYADCLYQLEQYTQAINAFNQALTLLPTADHPEILTNIGDCYEQTENFDQAIRQYKKALKLNPQNHYTYFRMSETFAKQEKWRSALTNIQKALQIDDNDPEYWMSLGYIQAQLQNIPAADTAYQTATQKTPQDEQVWIEYAGFLIDQNTPEKALQIVNEGIQQVSTEGALLYCKVACLLDMGQHKAATLQFAEAYEKAPQLLQFFMDFYPELQNNLNNLLGGISLN